MKRQWRTGLLAMMVVTSLWLSGCATEDSSEAAGQLRLALASTGSNGISYGLDARLTATGPEELTADLFHMDGSFEGDLIAGEYLVELSDFVLYRIDNGVAIEESRAELLTDNPSTLFIEGGAVTTLTLTFAVPGGEVTFDRGTFELGLEVLEGLPVGSDCLVHSDCASGECFDGVCVSEGIAALEAALSCEFPLGAGPGTLGLTLDIVPSKKWTQFGEVELGLSADVRISEELAQLVLDLGQEALAIGQVVAEIQATGTTSESFTIKAGPAWFELDRNGDGLANDNLHFELPLASRTLRNDGAAQVDFTVTALTMSSDVPIVGHVEFAGSMPPSTFPCELSSTALSLPVEADSERPDGASCFLNEQCASDLCRNGVCQAADPSIASASLFCELPLQMGQTSMELGVDVAPSSAWSSGSSVEVSFDATVFVPAALAQLVMDLGGSDQLEVLSVAAQIEVEGGAPSPIELLGGFHLLDLDADDDGVAEDQSFAVLVDPTTISNDGSPAVRFSVTELAVTLDVPLLGQVTVGEDSSVVSCQLSSSSASFDIEQEPAELLPDGASCTTDAECISGQCTDALCGAPDIDACPLAGSCVDGVCPAASAQDAQSSISCALPLGLGNVAVDVALTIAPESSFTPELTTDVELEAMAVLPASLGQILLNLGTDQIQVESILAVLSVDGASPSSLDVALGASTFDVDANNDGTAEDVVIAIPVGPSAFTTECAASVDFSVSHFEVSLSNVPLLGSLAVSEDPSASDISCALTSGGAAFPTLNP